MRPPPTRVYVHCVWSTRERLPLVTPENEPILHSAVRAALAACGCTVHAVGGVADHVHVVLRGPPAISLDAAVAGAKMDSEDAVLRLMPGRPFRWARAYGAVRVCERDVGVAAAYARTQRARHASGQVFPAWERAEGGIVAPVAASGDETPTAVLARDRPARASPTVAARPIVVEPTRVSAGIARPPPAPGPRGGE